LTSFPRPTPEPRLLSAHEHYAPDAGGAFTLAIFQDAAAELREHGHEPPYEFLISPADETVVTAISPGFLSVNEALVNAGILAAQVNFSGATVNGKRPIGAISDFRVWVVPGMPDSTTASGSRATARTTSVTRCACVCRKASAPRNCADCP
jgi:hypothetical protein